MEGNKEVIYELKPKFDFLYELTMPTGKKIKSALICVIFVAIVTIILFASNSTILKADNETLILAYNVCKIIMSIILIFTIIMLAFRIIFQILEYKGMSYKFYKDCLVVENNFLNQTKKTVEYSNIREVEIRRSILDRILNYGVIIIYTNAEKMYGSATVIYAIKNTQEHYNNIDSIIHNGNIVSNPIKSEHAGTRNDEIELQNAMNKNEDYNDSNALSDNNPLNKN